MARDQAWVSQLKGQNWPFSLVSSGRPFHGDLRRHGGRVHDWLLLHVHRQTGSHRSRWV